MWVKPTDFRSVVVEQALAFIELESCTYGIL
jgi:hypothetical protein